MSKYIFKLFVPPKYKPYSLDSSQIKFLLGHESFKYASFGRYALIHCLLELNIQGKVLISVYLCNSVKLELEKRGWEVIYYDIDIRDLNADIKSIERQIINEKPEAIVVASMYGNPANLIDIEKLCRLNNVKMIDDAAQSIGSSINGRQVGSFGDAGFFSVSPGKPLPGGLGAFYWVLNRNINSELKTKNNTLIHFLIWLDYYVHRRGAYTISILDPFNFITKLKKLLLKHIDMLNDSMSYFEKKLIGGAINALVNNNFEFRKYGFEIINTALININNVKLIKPCRGDSHPHKAVLVLENKDIAFKLKNYLSKKNIKTLSGYELLCTDVELVPNAIEINKRIVEIPIEKDSLKMNYLANLIKNYLLENEFKK